MGTSATALFAALLLVGLTSPAAPADATPDDTTVAQQADAGDSASTEGGDVAAADDAADTAAVAESGTEDAQETPAAETGGDEAETSEQTSGSTEESEAAAAQTPEAPDASESEAASSANEPAAEDEPALSTLSIEASTESGNPLPGVSFELWQESNHSRGLQQAGTADTYADLDCTTAGDGSCTVGEDSSGAATLTPGTYYWVQTETPDGYQAPEDSDEPAGTATISTDEAGTDLDPTEVSLDADADDDAADEAGTDDGDATTEGDESATGGDEGTQGAGGTDNLGTDGESASNEDATDEAIGTDSTGTSGESDGTAPNGSDRSAATVAPQVLAQPLATIASDNWSLRLSSQPNSGSTVTPGATIRYTLTASNRNRQAVTGASVPIDVSDVLQSADLETPLPNGLTKTGNTLTWAPTQIPGCGWFIWCWADGETSVSFKVTVKDTLTEDVTFSTTAAAGDKGNCSGDCSATHTVDVPEPASPVCASGYVYAVTDGGQVKQITSSGTSNFGDHASGVNSFNGLGIGANGSSMFAYERSNNSATAAIYEFDTSNGTWSSTGNSLNSSNNGGSVVFVAGAVNLNTGQYMFGGFNSSGNSFRIWSYDPSSQNTAYLGYLDTSSGSGGSNNGDMAFDSNGNLFVVRGSGSTTTVFSVTAANLANASGSKITSAQSASVSTMSDVNGVAFDANGRAYLGSGSTVRSYAMPTWTNRQDVHSSGNLNSTDLASCSSPATITIEKYVEGARVDPNDQFTLTLKQGNQVLGTATTTGSQSGVQDQRVGPLPAARGVQLSFSETFTNNNGDDYASSYQCTVDGATTPVVSGAGTSGTVSIPPGAEAVVCQFHNSPLVADVTIHKEMTDEDGNDPEPYPGWTVNADVVATQGSASRTPTTAQDTNGSGDAVWTIGFDSPNDRATLTVSEDQVDGFMFLGGQCTVTGLDGSTDQIDLTGISSELTGIEPGDSVSCIYVNRPLASDISVVKSAWNTPTAGGLPGAAEITDGSSVVDGTTITWSYLVTNTGETTLHNIVVNDDQAGAADCPSTTLAPQASMTCTASGPVTALS